MTTYPLTAASRAELDQELRVLAGQVPDDLCGHVFFNSPAGTVNNALPYPKLRPDGSHNPEYGNIIFNGDAVVIRFDLDQPGRVRVRTGLLKTPCYHADEASKFGTENYNNGLKFKPLGISRTGQLLGVRNQVNTAFTPFRFADDQPTRLTANFDAGRPYEIDPVSLTIKTPVGWNCEWPTSMPSFLEYTFPLVQTSAHPSFDPHTQEYFSVCFQKTIRNLLFDDDVEPTEANDDADDFVENAGQWLEERLAGVRLSAYELLRVVQSFASHIQSSRAADYQTPDGQRRNDRTERQLNFDLEATLKTHRDNQPHRHEAGLFPPNAVYLLRWTGLPGADLDCWNVVDADTGENLVMLQTMHQTNFSRDYIVLVDSSLKFSVDIMLNVPFPNNPALSALVRRLLAKTQEPTTPLYIIRRADLVADSDTVTARRLIVPLETVHYSIDYDNPNGRITLHTAHNCASCVAEWVRPFDTLAIDSNGRRNTPALPNTYGLMASGAMDLGRIGKFVVDGNTAQVLQQHIIAEKGFQTDPATVQAHTWAVGLNTYRGMVSADAPTAAIRHNFWQCYGLDYRLLTNFLKDLYTDYQNRIVPVDDLLEYTRHGIPFCLLRQDTDTMQFADYYLFKVNENLRSLQFVPRARTAGETVPVDEQLDGYIFCTMIIGDPNDLTADEYSREIWIFDAAELSEGPVCKLYHPDLIFSFTIHSAWLLDCQSFESGYTVPVKPDYDQVLAGFWNPDSQRKMQIFMDAYVYPHY